jgi:hypothetical protein
LVKEGGQPKWKAFAKQGARHGDPISLFGPPAPTTLDPVFANRGLLRTPVQVRGMSRPPNPTLPPNLLLALRALIGVSSRAEVILCRATGPAANPSKIARQTGYRARTMQILPQEMALSVHVLTPEADSRPAGKTGRGSSRIYHLKAADWCFLSASSASPSAGR